MPNQDLASALVTERSKELLNYTWLKYVAILGVMNDLRRTIPILSRVHSRDLGYMIDDVKKYHEALAKVGDQLGVTMNRVKQLGDIARQHGLNRETFVSGVAEAQGVFNRSGNSAYDLAKARQYEMVAQRIGSRLGGFNAEQFNKLDAQKKAERYIELFAEYIAKLRAAGRTDVATRDLDAAQQAGFLTQRMRESALDLSRSNRTPALRLYNETYLQGRGARYEKEARAAASAGGQTWKKFEIKEQEFGGPLLAPDMVAKIQKLKEAYSRLIDVLAKLKEKFTAIVVRSNIDFFTSAIKAVTWLGEKILALASYVDRLSRRFQWLFALPVVNSIMTLGKWIALWYLFGKIVPRILTRVAFLLARLIFGSKEAGLAFEFLGKYASKYLKWMYSPLHSISFGLRLLGRGALWALNAIRRLTLARMWQAMGAGVGFVVTQLRALAVAGWAAVPPLLLIMGKFLLIAAIVYIVAEAVNTVIWLILRLLGYTTKWSSILVGAKEALEWMSETLGFSAKKSEAAFKDIDDGLEHLRKNAGKPGESLAASFKAISQQDLFGGILQQILDIPDRIMPSAMKLIKSQLNYAKNDLTASFLGVARIENETQVRINLRDETGHAIGDFVSYGH